MSNRLASSLNSPQIIRYTLNDCLWPMAALRERPLWVQSM